MTSLLSPRVRPLTVLLYLAGALGAAEPVRDAYVVPDDAAFLRLLDLSQPELAAVKTALDAGDTKAAAQAYMARFRRGSIQSPLLTDWRTTGRAAASVPAAADAFLAGHLNDGYSVYEVPASGLDWRVSPLSCVTRFPLLGPVRWAYHHSRDPKYARWLVDHMLGFVQAWPMSEYLTHTSREGWTNHNVVAKPWYWCMIPERIHELSESINLLRDCPEVSDEELLTLLRRLLEETGYCDQEIKLWVVDLRHNGGCAMIESQAMACTVLADFVPARARLARAGEMAASYLDRAFYPDGMCVELTVAYSLECSRIAQRFAHALRDQPALQAQRDKVAALVTSIVGLSEPVGGLPAFGDLYPSSLDHGLYVPALDWLHLPWARAVLDGHAEPAPPFLVWPRPGQEQWSGYYTMRSDWGKAARYLTIDGGPWGTTHQHGDRLSFVLDAGGARFIIDPSSTRYASNEPGAFISGQVASFLHNTITLDGIDEFMETPAFLEAKEPLRNTWEHGADYSLFAGRFSFAPLKPVTWERRVLFAAAEYWFLQDALNSPAAAGVAVEQNFQFEADIQIAFEGKRTVATAPNGARLVLLPLQDGLTPTLSCGVREPHPTYWHDGKSKLVQRQEDGVEQKHGRGWTGRSSDRLMPAPAVTYSGQLDLPVLLTTLLIPLPPGQDAAALPQVDAHADGEQTRWNLTTSRGKLALVTSLAGCQVVK